MSGVRCLTSSMLCCRGFLLQLAVSLVQVLGSLRHVRPTNPKTRSVLAPSKSSAIDGVETYARSLSPDVWRGLSEHSFGRGIISLKDVGDNAGEVLGKGFEVHERGEPYSQGF